MEDQRNEQNDNYQEIHTGGGTYVEGRIDTGGGDFVGRDRIVYETHYHYVERPAPEFPYLAPNLPPHHIPREDVLTTLRGLLLGHERQVAVTALRGMGGVGKTTLAIALCHDKQVIEACTDGILWATLGPQADLLSAQTTWGDAFGVDLSNLPDVEARAARLRSLFHGKRCLLVIDDVWDATHLSPMQVGGPHCVTLVTTRERKIAQKVGTALDLDVLQPGQALLLLAQWTGEIAEDEKAVAGELAKRLGYLPLALALAGAQAQDGESWADLLAVFRNRQGTDITLLDLDDPSVRDESLALTFDLSLKRLGDALPEQFAMLGVFAAGREAPFSAEAAAAVWDVAAIPAKKLLGRLVRAALVDRIGDHYTLHLLLGDYARSLLDETRQMAPETRHQAFYLKVAQNSKQAWETAEVALPQMRTAWDRLAKDDPDELYSWADATSDFFEKRGYWSAMKTWVGAVLTAAKAKGQRSLEGWCENALGNVYSGTSEIDKALVKYKISLDIHRQIGDRFVEARTLRNLGDIYRLRGELGKALGQYQLALTIHHQIDDREEEAWLLTSIGEVYLLSGKWDEALDHYNASLIIFRETGQRIGEAWTLRSMGLIHRRRDELEEALTCAQASLEIMHRAGHRDGEAWAHHSLGQVYRLRGELVDAMKHYQASLDIFIAGGDRNGEGYAHTGIGQINELRGEFDGALARYQISLDIFREANAHEGLALTLRSLGKIYERLECLDKAKEYYTEVLILLESSGMSEANEVREELSRVNTLLNDQES